MEISRITAIVIKTNEVSIDVYGNGTNYGFEISHLERGNFRSDLTSEPVFNSEAEARQSGEGLVAEIKKMDVFESK